MSEQENPLDDLAPRLRECLIRACFTYDGVADLLGTTAHAALFRNETQPGLRATGDGSPVATLTRLWLLQAAVGSADAERALPGLVDQLCHAGLLEQSNGEVRAQVDVRPYAADELDLWVASDLTPGLDGRPYRVRADHVLGVSSASTSLAQLTVRDPTGSALDLGTGCGVQSLHLAAHCARVVATDVNRRALAMTRFNVQLNGLSQDDRVEVREGSYFEPVTGEEFDLVVTNPPFVISPATGERLVYRDSGLPGDLVVEQLVRQLPVHLRPGGIGQVLGNWSILRDVAWKERVAGWLRGADAWVVQREVVDLPEYVELWLKDAGLHGGPDYVERYDTWLTWFEQQGVEAIGMGWLNLRRTDAEPVLRLDEWPWAVEQPLGPEVASAFARTDALRALGEEQLLSARPVRRKDVRQETYGEPGAADPAEIVLRQQRGLRRARQVSTAEAALVGACDGELSLGQLQDALHRLGVGRVPETTVRELVAEGFLELVS